MKLYRNTHYGFCRLNRNLITVENQISIILIENS